MTFGMHLLYSTSLWIKASAK
uniref:Uncharacterized protein n=1 Tax=Anguilla anguilla TaxID=7936 RepID=A0A0E9TI75_ANGAN